MSSSCENWTLHYGMSRKSLALLHGRDSTWVILLPDVESEWAVTFSIVIVFGLI